jgi:uncharacterized protein YbcI
VPVNDDPPKGKGKGDVRAAINDGLVALHTRFYGKGPTAAKSHYLERDDAVICFMWEGFTTVEETLIAVGRGDSVADQRRSFQAAMEEEFTAVVEAATGRTVSAYLTQVHIDPNLVVEIFLLESRVTP